MYLKELRIATKILIEDKWSLRWDSFSGPLIYRTRVLNVTPRHSVPHVVGI